MDENFPKVDEPTQHGDRKIKCVETEPKSMIILLQCDQSYLCTVKGMTQLLHLIFSSIALSTLLSSGRYSGCYLNNQMESYIRPFLFLLVFTFLSTFVDLLAHLYHLQIFLHANFLKIELVLYIIYTSLYFIMAPIILGSLTFYHHVLDKWAFHQILISTVVSYICMIMCSIIALKSWNQLSLPRFHLSNHQRYQRFSISTLT